MAFTDLPENWSTRPITDPSLLTDVLDLVVSDRSRARGALYLLLCDTDDRLVLPVCIDDIADAGGPEQRVELLRPMLSMIAQMEPTGGVLVAIARPGGLSATGDDRGWADALRAATGGQMRLLGVHVVTADGSRPVPVDRPAA